MSLLNPKFGGTTVVDPGSSIMAGPSALFSRGNSSRQNTGVLIRTPSNVTSRSSRFAMSQLSPSSNLGNSGRSPEVIVATLKATGE